ncbi:MAG: helix-turn-helix transcriptional regulator [Betaproteobacteria bacterium]
MRKLHVFLFVLTATLSVLVTLLAVSLYYAATAPTYYGDSWMGQMWGSHLGTNQDNWGMGGMMGNTGTTSSYLWIIPTALIAVVAIAIIGVAFYFAYPELKYIRSSRACNPQTPIQAPAPLPTSTAPPVASNSQNCDVILKTMTPEEQKVYNVLAAHKGKYLQKYIVKEAGLSRLKTHRIVARFAQRGIVTVNEFGNTNEIVLSDWASNNSTNT